MPDDEPDPNSLMSYLRVKEQEMYDQFCEDYLAEWDRLLSEGTVDADA